MTHVIKKGHLIQVKTYFMIGLNKKIGYQKITNF